MTDSRVPITGKALQVYGKDSVSTEKIKEVLGIEEEDIKEAERQRLAKQEEELQRTRQLALFNKREAKKALERLGVDPSNQKIMDKLGVDECVIKEAKMENFQRYGTALFIGSIKSFISFITLSYNQIEWSSKSYEPEKIPEQTRSI